MSEPHRPDRLDAGFFIFSLIGTILSFACAGFLAFLHAGPPLRFYPTYSLISDWTILSCCAMGLLGVSATIVAGRGLRSAAPQAPIRPNPHWLWIFLIVPIGIALHGFQLGGLPSLGLLGLMGNILAASAAVFAIIILVRWVGPPISARRAWGQFLLGLWGAIPIALILEFLTPILAFAILLSLRSTSSRIEALLQQFRNLLSTFPRDIDALVRESLHDPWIVVLAFVFATVLVPIIEEAAKTVAVWPLLRRRISPAEAFLGGALSGAGFGLVEMYFLASPGPGWPAMLVGRMAATLMHCMSSALASWGLAEGFVRRNWRRLAAGYLGSVLIHGAWNAAVLFLSAGDILPYVEEGSLLTRLPRSLPGFSMLLMLALAAGATIALPVSLAKLRREDEALVEA